MASASDIRVRALLWIALACACSVPHSRNGDAASQNHAADAARRRSPKKSRKDAVLILSVERYRALPPREGAHELAAAWYDHLHRHRGVPRRRMVWLKDEDVEPAQVADALNRVHWRIGEDATLWFIFIGHAGHGPAAPAGWLFGAAATAEGEAGVPFAQLFARASHGAHRQLVAVVDGCLPEPSSTWSSGMPALVPPPLSPRRMPAPVAFTPGPVSLGQAMAEANAHLMRDVDLRRREPTDSVLFTAGAGDRCASPRPDAPPLAALLLGLLRAPIDLDGNGAFTVVDTIAALRGELARHPMPRPTIQVHGADLLLSSAPVHASASPSTPAPAPASTTPAEDPLLLTYDPDRQILIDRGRFTQGCASRRDPDCERDERPRRRITLDRFKIDPYEVTRSDYARCVQAAVCPPIDPALCEVWTGDAFVRGAPIPERFTGPDQPVICATWYNARAYCEWTGGRLPTESEWERAARGAGDRRRYPWGDAAPTCARARLSGCGDGPAPVGAHPRGVSPEGLFDLAGNVAEWVADWYHPRAYHLNPSDNPAGPDRGRVRVVRGGSFYDPPEQLRSSYRYGLTPTFGYGIVGFRCAR